MKIRIKQTISYVANNKSLDVKEGTVLESTGGYFYIPGRKWREAYIKKNPDWFEIL